MSPGDRMKRGKNLAQRLTLPQEVVSQGPLAELHGNTSVCIENHGGILEYTDTRVCIAVQRGTLTVSCLLYTSSGQKPVDLCTQCLRVGPLQIHAVCALRIERVR